MAQRSTSEDVGTGDAQETARLFREFRRTGDRALRDDLVLRHRWIAERFARRFAQSGEPIDDLVQVATLALVLAVDRYDPERGSAFTSFAVPTVLGALKRYFRDATWRIKVPRASRDLLATVKGSMEALTHELGRTPTIDELAAATTLHRDVVLDVIGADNSYTMQSLTTPLDGGDGLAPIDVVPEIDSGLLRADMRVDVLTAMRLLDARSRRILLWRFYEERTQTEIGDRLGISQVQVSRLIRSALVELRVALRELPLDAAGALVVHGRPADRPTR